MNSKLHLPNAWLWELPSLEHMPYTMANVEGNKLMSLEGLPASLTRLNACSNNILHDGFFLPFPNLEELRVCHNPLNIRPEDDMLACYPSLKYLQITHNRLRSTEAFRDLPLETLNISQNPLSCISGLPQTLQFLIANDCHNVVLIQSKLPPSLEYISLSYNSLRYAGLPLNWSACLKELHLDHNEIERFPRNLPDSLEALTLNKNKLKCLPSHLPASLKILSVCSNRLQYVPSYTRRFLLLLLDDNCLAENNLQFEARVFSAKKNWNEEKHHRAQTKIKQCWKRYVLTLRLRHYKRTQKTKEELFQISMMPERWQQIDTYDSVWYRSYEAPRPQPH